MCLLDLWLINDCQLVEVVDKISNLSLDFLWLVSLFVAQLTNQPTNQHNKDIFDEWPLESTARIG